MSQEDILKELKKITTLLTPKIEPIIESPGKSWTSDPKTLALWKKNGEAGYKKDESNSS